MGRTKQGWRTVLICALLTAATLAAYWPVTRCAFLNYDDNVFVTQNPRVAGGLTWANVAWAFHTTLGGNWQPLTWLSHMLDAQFFGLRPGWHHLTNLLLHVANTVLLFLVLTRATGAKAIIEHRTSNLEPRTSSIQYPASSIAPQPSTALRCAMVAGLFALHPLHVESVAWVAERKDVLSGLFFMLTLLAYARYAQCGGWSAESKIPNREAVAEQEGGSGGPFPLTPALSLREREDLRQRAPEPGAPDKSKALGADLPPHEPQSERDGPLSLSLSPSEGERVPKAGEGSVHGSKARTGWGISLPKGEGWGEGEPSARSLRASVLAPGAGTSNGRLWYLLALMSFALGLMSKPMLVTVPFVLLLLDYWPLRRLQLSTLFEMLPFFILSAASCVVAFIAQRASESVYPLAALPLTQRLANAVVAYAMYLRDTFWPVGLGVFYPLPQTVPALTVIAAGAVVLGITVLVLVVGRRGGDRGGQGTSNIEHRTSNIEHRTSNIEHPASRIDPQPSTFNPQPSLAVGWFWFVGMLVPVIGLVQVGLQARADRYTYLPLIGVCIMVVWGALGGRASARALTSSDSSRDLGSRGRSPSPLWAAGLAAGLVLLALGLRTRDQLRHWQDSESLFRQAITVAKDNWLAHYNLAEVLRDRGQLDEAVKEYQRAIDIHPGYVHAHHNLANLLLRQGQVDAAIAHFDAALQVRPDDALTHRSLGTALLARGQVDEAIMHLQKALELGAGQPGTHSSLGNALLRKGRLDEAITQLQEAVRLRPDFARARCSLGGALLGKGRATEALAQFETALAAQPDNPGILDTVAWVFATCPDASVRNGPRAVELAEHASQLTGGGNASALGTLAAAHAEAGRFPEAVATVQRALELAARGAGAQTTALRVQLASYQAGAPFRDPGLAPRK